MLRVAVLLLLLANAAFFAWSQGLLAQWGVGAVQQSEPHRLRQQIRPEAIRVIPAGQARAAAEHGAGECFQAGLFTTAESDRLKQVLQAWPSGTWALEPGAEAARWIVYMGRYSDNEHVVRKKAELRYRGVSFEPVANAALEPGLSLGGFASEAAAMQQLEALAARGVRTARVVLERAEVRGMTLKFSVVDESLRGRLEGIHTALAGKPLRPCR